MSNKIAVKIQQLQHAIAQIEQQKLDNTDSHTLAFLEDRQRFYEQAIVRETQ